MLLGGLPGCAASEPWRGLVKIGLVQPFHGPDPEEAMSIHVRVRDLVIERNRGGGLRGWRLELVSLDGEADVQVGARRVAELRRDPAVVLILAAPSLLSASAGQGEPATLSLGLNPGGAIDRALNAIESAAAVGPPTRESVRSWIPTAP